MKLALLSDIHANLQALDACLTHARNAGAQRFALLGDLVGYGGDPGAVVNRIMALASEGAVVLKGNHDEMALYPPQRPQQIGDATAHWTQQQLSEEQLSFLASCPLMVQVEHCLLVHASAEAPEKWRYVDDERSAGISLKAAMQRRGISCVLGGHVHLQRLYHQGQGRGLMVFKPSPGVEIPLSRHRHWLATVGSVGQPRDGDTAAMYALFDMAQSRLTFHRVPYDHTAAAASIRSAGLPEYFAQRLEMGR